MAVYLKTKQLIFLFALSFFYFLPVNKALAQEATEPMTGHAFYGKMVIPNDDADMEGGDYQVNIFGADVQKAFGGEVLKYGVETGAFFSMDSDVRHFSASSGGSATVAVDVNSLMFDYFFGCYLGFEPAKWLRLNVGAGPLLIWASRETEPDASIPEAPSPASESGFGAGLYARAGIDIFFTEVFGIYAGARINETTLSFEDTAGKIDIGGVQYCGGLAFRF